MATTVIPAVIDALVDQTRAAVTTSGAKISVYDGYGLSDDPGDFLMVGVEDPETQGFTTSASAGQNWAETGQSAERDDIGDVTCCAMSWNGDADQKAARDRAFAVVGVVEDLLRTDSQLGLDDLLWAEIGPQMELHQIQDDSGAAAWVIFRVHYEARI